MGGQLNSGWSIKMAKVVLVLALMVLISTFVEGRDWRFKSSSRVKRGFNGGFGSDSSYGRRDNNGSGGSREGLSGCSGESDKSYSGSREQLGYNRDGRVNDTPQGRRTYSKASASASASSSNKHHNYGV